MSQEQEFTDFVATNRSRLMRYARKFSFVGEDPEDLLQSALVKAWRSLPAFRRECSYSAWTSCIVRSLALQTARNAARRRSIAPILPFPDRFDVIDKRLNIERDAIDASVLRAVRRAVRTFTPVLQAAFYEMLGDIPRSSAVSHITRKVRRFRLKQALIEYFCGHAGEVVVPHETEETAQNQPAGPVQFGVGALGAGNHRRKELS
jgi:RNA polymerase sigma-70 factor (ECF subfamily)